MLSEEKNRILTHVDKGSPMGDLMRRHWHPIAAVAELDESVFRTKEIRLLGEDLVLFKDRSGTLGLIEKYCSHRRVNLARGIVEDDGIRCPYHGWKFDSSGSCIEQPFEATTNRNSRYKEKCGIGGYRVEVLAGAVWAYIGPDPVPYLPKWGPLVWDECIRDISIATLECNWLQCQENSPDPVHTEWLHAYLGDFAARIKNTTDVADFKGLGPTAGRPTQKIRFREFDHGQVKMRMVEGDTGEEEDWMVGHPTIFPHGLATGCQWAYTLQFRVPIDNTHTYHLSVNVFPAAPGQKAPSQSRVPYRNVPLYDADGNWIIDNVFNQDYMAWTEQGPIAQRHLEKLGSSDVGIVEYRKMLFNQIAAMEEDKPLMNVFFDEETSSNIEIPLEKVKHRLTKRPTYVPRPGERAMLASDAGISDDADLIEEVLATWDTIPEYRVR